MLAELKKKVPWFAIATLAIGALLTTLASRYVEKQETHLLLSQIDDASNVIVSNTSLHLRYREQSLERIAQRLQKDPTISRSDWEKETLAYLERQPGYLQLVVVRLDRDERWSVPAVSAEEQSSISEAFPHSLLRAAKPTPEQAGKAHIKSGATLSNGDRILPISYPLFADGTLFGYFVALLDTQQIFDNLLNEFSGLLPNLSVEEQGQVIYRRGNIEPRLGLSSTQQLHASFENHDLDWTVTVQANPLTVAQSVHVKPVVLFLGYAISLAMALIVFIVQQNLRYLGSKVAAEKTADESSKFLDLVMQQSPDLIFVKDAQYRIVLANPAMLALYPEEYRDNIIAYPPSEGSTAEETKELQRSDSIAFKQGWSETEDNCQFPDGKLETLSITKTRFYDQNKQPFIFCVGRKITELKQTNAKLSRSNRELDNFAYVASHDLRVPLRGINNHVRFLREDYGELFDDGGRHRLDRLIQLTQRMENLIADLLYYARLGREEDNMKVVDLKALVVDISNSYEQLNLQLGFVGELPVLECNELRVTELFSNLIDNAISYNDKDIREVTIECQYSNAIEGNGLLFSIRDNGVGIAEEFHQEVFVLFRRLHSENEHGSGNGAGLTFVRKIVALHGGDVWLNSELGKGSTFFFTLPNAKVL